MNWYLEAMKKYAVFNGRSRRKEYWYFFLFNIIISIILRFIDVVIGSFSVEAGMGLFGSVYILAVLVPWMAVMVRRLHDVDLSGWWMLLGVFPYIGAIVLLVFMTQDSNPDENQYGENPKREAV